ncbi:hypothetical protein ACUN3E_01760 [Streptomyces sp. Ju416(a)]|uniref:hypothetical protein n=1 Tax=Streptomyces sp. Ju416(a) TaxID=3446591 RepID=UPI00403DB055
MTTEHATRPHHAPRTRSGGVHHPDSAQAADRDRRGRAGRRTGHHHRPPYTGLPLAEFPVSAPEDVEAAFARARVAQKAWADLLTGALKVMQAIGMR